MSESQRTQLSTLVAPTFATVRRGGYRVEDVDAYVAAVVAHLAEVTAAPDHPVSASESPTGSPTKVLMLAEAAAAELRATAERERAQLIAQAEADIAQRRAAADRELADQRQQLADLVEVQSRTQGEFTAHLDRAKVQIREVLAGVAETLDRTHVPDAPDPALDDIQLPAPATAPPARAAAPVDAEPDDAEPDDAEPDDAEPDDAEPVAASDPVGDDVDTVEAHTPQSSPAEPAQEMVAEESRDRFVDAGFEDDGPAADDAFRKFWEDADAPVDKWRIEG